MQRDRMILEETDRIFTRDKLTFRGWRGTDRNGDEVLALISHVIILDPPDEPKPHLFVIPPSTREQRRKWAELVLADLAD